MKRVTESESGFTIIEVVLFLAVSAGMILAAMIAVQGRTQSVQYTDSVRSVEAFIDRRISQVLSGSITNETQQCRWNGASYSAGSSDGSCIFLGYLFRFNPANRTQIEVMQFYGARLPTNDPCFAANPTDPLYCVSPTPTPVTGSPASVETFQIPWGMEFYYTLSAGTPNSQYMGYLRNPIGQNLIPVSFAAGQESNIDDPAYYRTGSGGTHVGDEFSGFVCLRNDGKKAAVTLGGQNRQFAVEASFDVGDVTLCP